MVGDVIYYLLSNDATVSGYLGTKIYPNVTPQGITTPFLIYQTATEPTKIKNSVSPLDLINIDIVFFTDTSSEGDNIKTAIRNLLDRYTGTVLSNEVDKINFEDDRDLFDEDSELYRFDLRYSLRLKK